MDDQTFCYCLFYATVLYMHSTKELNSSDFSVSFKATSTSMKNKNTATLATRWQTNSSDILASEVWILYGQLKEIKSAFYYCGIVRIKMLTVYVNFYMINFLSPLASVKKCIKNTKQFDVGVIISYLWEKHIFILTYSK